MRTRPIVQLKNGKPKAIFSSMRVTRNYGYDPTDVSHCVRGVRNHHAGHQWEYLSENNVCKINTKKKGKNWDMITARTITNYGIKV
jgi:hypothetical protein